MRQCSPESDFQVEPAGGGVSARIIRYLGSDWAVRIPSYIRGLPVTEIGRGAFRGRNLTEVVIPNTVLEIEADAFRNNQLASVAIPDSVTRVGFLAFRGNDTLTSVTIPFATLAAADAAWTNRSEFCAGALSWRYGIPAGVIRNSAGVVVN